MRKIDDCHLFETVLRIDIFVDIFIFYDSSCLYYINIHKHFRQDRSIKFPIHFPSFSPFLFFLLPYITLFQFLNFFHFQLLIFTLNSSFFYNLFFFYQACGSSYMCKHHESANEDDFILLVFTMSHRMWYHYFRCQTCSSLERVGRSWVRKNSADYSSMFFDQKIDLVREVVVMHNRYKIAQMHKIAQNFVSNFVLLVCNSAFYVDCLILWHNSCYLSRKMYMCSFSVSLSRLFIFTSKWSATVLNKPNPLSPYLLTATCL